MQNSFLTKLIADLNSFLDLEPEILDDSYSWKISNSETKDFVFTTIYSIENDGNESIILSIFTNIGLFELHDINNYKILANDDFAMWTESESKVNLVTISSNLTLSFYSNLDLSILDTDILDLSESQILANSQLSMIFVD
jgi:hypothetical protein